MTLLTTSQAAAELGVTERRIRQLVKTGILPAQQVSGVWVIAPKSLEKARKRPDGRGRPKKGGAKP